MAYQQHHQASANLCIRCAVITLSDTRNESTDKSGQAIRTLLTEQGHEIVHYQILKDEPADLEKTLTDLFSRENVDAILTNGGTGISRRDQTISVIERCLDRAIPGFGELFRMLSWQEIGSGAMLSRAVAGVAKRKLIFAMPGSTAGVQLAMTKLILPELKHLVYELRK